jgi:hypothetical protein
MPDAIHRNEIGGEDRERIAHVFCEAFVRTQQVEALRDRIDPALAQQVASGV